MNLLDVIIVLSVLLVVSVAVGIILTYRHRQQQLKEMDFGSASRDIYNGPAGDPYWNGRLPKTVHNYTEPRYVYENLEESTEYLPENGRIIGYRISPELVIHSRIKQDMNAGEFKSYIERFGGRLLNFYEIELLLENWEQISILRQKAGDSPLTCDREVLGIHKRDLVSFYVEYLPFPKLCGFYLNPNYYTSVSLVLKR